MQKKDWSIVNHQWKLTEAHIADRFSHWDALSAVLHTSHANRAEGTGELMDEAVALYEEVYAYYEGTIEPINQQERLSFVRMNRSRFAAYRQLAMLFEEFRKQLAAKRIRSEFEKTELFRKVSAKSKPAEKEE